MAENVQQYQKNESTIALVAKSDFFKSVSQISRRGGGGSGKMLPVEYVHRISSSTMHNHKSQHGTRVQQRLRNKNREKYDAERYVKRQHASKWHVNSRRLSNSLD
jgi:hypothetical protein